ncbi:MAG: exodeoxyribonuclease VII large subunit, partial [Odoribacter sp.]|nr:exodeoxyribonuclease VII large subunit [Odoribacter sp.]
MDYISLYELNSQVKQVLKAEMGSMVWVSAELTSVQENRSGHCYLELVDKPEDSDKPVAVARATIWAFTYGMIKSYFETTTGRRLERGMKVLVKVEVVFHEVYGYSLNVKDIDPTFTLGDLEQKRRLIIKQLEEDGIIEMNKSLELPLLPKTIAIISSPTAAGLGDFMNQIQNNSYGYQFHIKLFPAVMQGDKAKDSIISVLDRIYEYESLFDAVVIIRGGGSQMELGCFDDYELAANIAQFPLPIIAGIGHERDETIADMVSFKSVKTPTAAAAFLVDMFHEAELSLQDMKGRFITGVNYKIQEEYSKQKIYLTEFRRMLQILLDYNEGNLKTLSYKLERATQGF